MLKRELFENERTCKKRLAKKSELAVLKSERITIQKPKRGISKNHFDHEIIWRQFSRSKKKKSSQMNEIEGEVSNVNLTILKTSGRRI